MRKQRYKLIVVNNGSQPYFQEKRKSYFLPRKRISISGLISTGICYDQFQRVFPSCQPLFIEVVGNDGLTIHFK